MNNRSLVFMEFEKEIDYLEKISLGQGEELVVLTTSPNCQRALEERGILVFDPTKYFTTSSHEKTSKWSTDLLDHIREQFKDEIEKELGFQTYSNFLTFYTQFYINYLVYHAELFLNFIETEKCSKVFSFSGRPLTSQQVMIKDYEFPLDSVLKLVAHSVGIPSAAIDVSSLSPKNKRFLPIFRPLLALEKILQRMTLKKALRERLLVTSSSYPSFDRALTAMKEETGRRILYLHSGDNFARDGFDGTIKRSLKTIAFHLTQLTGLNRFLGYKNFDYIYSLENIHYSGERSAIFEDDFGLWEYLRGIKYCGIGLGNLVHQKLYASIKVGFSKLKQTEIEVKSLFRSAEDVIFVAPHSIGTSSLIAEVFDSDNKDSLLMAHGTMPPPGEKKFDRELFYISLVQLNSVSKRVLIQSKLEIEHLSYYSSSKKQYVHGPLVWGRSTPGNTFSRDKWGLEKKHKVFLHASSQKSRFSQRLLSYETPTEYIENIRSILKAVEEIPNGRLVVKFRPTSTLSLETLKYFLGDSKNLEIDVETPFVDALCESDALISYSSTTIEEAIFNKKPVVIYGGAGRGKFFPVRDQDDSGIIYCPSPIELKETLQRAIESKITEDDDRFYSLSKNERMSFREIENEIIKERFDENV